MNEFECTQEHIQEFSNSDFRIQILAIQLLCQMVLIRESLYLI